MNPRPRTLLPTSCGTQVGSQHVFYNPAGSLAFLTRRNFPLTEYGQGDFPKMHSGQSFRWAYRIIYAAKPFTKEPKGQWSSGALFDLKRAIFDGIIQPKMVSGRPAWSSPPARGYKVTWEENPFKKQADLYRKLRDLAAKHDIKFVFPTTPAPVYDPRHFFKLETPTNIRIVDYIDLKPLGRGAHQIIFDSFKPFDLNDALKSDMPIGKEEASLKLMRKIAWRDMNGPRVPDQAIEHMKSESQGEAKVNPNYERKRNQCQALESVINAINSHVVLRDTRPGGNVYNAIVGQIDLLKSEMLVEELAAKNTALNSRLTDSSAENGRLRNQIAGLSRQSNSLNAENERLWKALNKANEKLLELVPPVLQVQFEAFMRALSPSEATALMVIINGAFRAGKIVDGIEATEFTLRWDRSKTAPTHRSAEEYLAYVWLHHPTARELGGKLPQKFQVQFVLKGGKWSSQLAAVDRMLAQHAPANTRPFSGE